MQTMSALSNLLGVLALSLLLAGCSPADLGPLWVEVGDGEDQHSPLADGDEVPIVMGPQLGYMIPLSLGASGVLPGDPDDPTDPDNPRMTFQAFLPDGHDPLGSITVVRGLSPTDAGDLELFGTWLIFDAALDTAVYFNQPIDVTVQITDTLGNDAAAAVTVTSTWPDLARSESAP